MASRRLQHTGDFTAGPCPSLSLFDPGCPARTHQARASRCHCTAHPISLLLWIEGPRSSHPATAAGAACRDTAHSQLSTPGSGFWKHSGTHH